MKTEMENLIRDRDLFKEEVCPMERTQALAELEKLKIEVKLQESQRKCDDLQETITRLMEEKRVSIDREKRAAERCDKIYAENLKMANEKNMLIFVLNEKINDLRNKNLESERLVGIYREKCKCSDTRLVKMGQEIEELRLKQSEVVKELKQQNVEANRTVDELRLKKLESDKAAKLNKSRIENLVPRIMKIKELLADMSNVKVGDLANIVDEMSKLATSEEGGNSDFPDFEGKKDGSGNGSTHDDAENVGVVSPGVRSTSNSTGIRCVGLSKKGNRNLVQHRAREDIADTVHTTPGLQSGCNPPQAESNDTIEYTKRKEPQVTDKMKFITKADERFDSSVTCRCNLKIMKDVHDKLDADHKEMLVNSCFGNFFRMKDYMKLSCKLLHSLMLMRIESRAADEIWFCLGGKKVRFSFWDFTLITGLNPSDEDRYENDIPSGRRLAKEYFQGRKVVKPGQLRDVFYNDAKNEDDRYKLGLALIYENVLKRKEARTCIDMEVLNIVDNLELFNKYPWGRKCYDILLYGLRKGFSKVPLAHYSLWGFPLALQVWAFETVPAIRKIFRAERTEQRLPRMCGWKSTLICSFDEIIELLNAPTNEILFPLTPTNKEEEQEYVRLFPDHLREEQPSHLEYPEPEIEGLSPQRDSMENEAISPQTQSDEAVPDAVLPETELGETSPAPPRRSSPPINLRQVLDAVLGLTHKVDDVHQKVDGAVLVLNQKVIDASKEGAHASGMRSSNKMACASSAAGDIIEIIDSDDERNLNGATHLSNKGIDANVGENEKIFEKFVESPSYSQTKRRNRTDRVKDFLTNSATKRKRNMCKSDEDNISIHEKENQVLKSKKDRIDCSSSGRCEEEKDGAACDSQPPLQKFSGLNGGNSTDSEDESCSDSRMDDLVASFRSEKLRRKWMYEADMARAFQDDVELCMHAVCALYRHQLFEGKSTKHSNLSKNGGFSPGDSMSGRALAEYLIDGDKDLRLRKSVAEVKKQRPEVIKECRKLATVYQEKLYEIYCEEEDDPFFGQT